VQESVKQVKNIERGAALDFQHMPSTSKADSSKRAGIRVEHAQESNICHIATTPQWSHAACELI
jgi:hypothetical protein